jgi:hypothetical protein
MCEFVVGYPDGKPHTPQHKDVCVVVLCCVTAASESVLANLGDSCWICHYHKQG